jgi:hypothetical protein
MFFASVESQYLVGASSPSGHSISRRSSAGFSARSWLDATLTRTRANREDSHSLVPSRHLIVRHAFARRRSATSLIEIALAGISAPLPGCTARPRARRPYQGLRLNTRHIALSDLSDALAQLGVHQLPYCREGRPHTPNGSASARSPVWLRQAACGSDARSPRSGPYPARDVRDGDGSRLSNRNRPSAVWRMRRARLRRRLGAVLLDQFGTTVKPGRVEILDIDDTFCAAHGSHPEGHGGENRRQARDEEGIGRTPASCGAATAITVASRRWSWRKTTAPTMLILGALLEAASHGLRTLSGGCLKQLPRMADFALWATACETVLWPAGTFIRAYEENRRAAIEGVIEADPVAEHVRDMLAKATTWTGSASDLHRIGADRSPDGRSARSSSWPKCRGHLPAGCVVPRPRFGPSASRSLSAVRVGVGARMIRMSASHAKRNGKTVSTVSDHDPSNSENPAMGVGHAPCARE